VAQFAAIPHSKHARARSGRAQPGRAQPGRAHLGATASSPLARRSRRAEPSARWTTCCRQRLAPPLATDADSSSASLADDLPAFLVSGVHLGRQFVVDSIGRSAQGRARCPRRAYGIDGGADRALVIGRQVAVALFVTCPLAPQRPFDVHPARVQASSNHKAPLQRSRSAASRLAIGPEQMDRYATHDEPGLTSDLAG
jgi:hypothetical protein